VGEAPIRLRTLLRVKTESDASRPAVPSETQLDGRRRPATASSGEWVSWSLDPWTVTTVWSRVPLPHFDGIL